MAALPDVLGPVLQELLACGEQSLIDIEAPPGRAFIQPGAEAAWDDCCDGQLWVRVGPTVPSGNPFPSQLPAARGGACDVPLYAVTVYLGVVRCTPTVSSSGKAPSPEALTASALEMTRDRAALEGAIRCCFQDVKNVQRMLLQAWNPLGAQGGCAGGEWTMILGLGTCSCESASHAPEVP